MSPLKSNFTVRCACYLFATVLLSACGGTTDEPSASSSSSSSSGSTSTSSSTSSSGTPHPSLVSVFPSTGDFENGQQEWTLYAFDEASVNVTWDGVAHYDITKPTTENWHIQLLNFFSIKNATNYTLCYDAKASANRTMYARIEDADKPHTALIDEPFINVSLNNHWQRFSHTFRSTVEDNTARLSFYLGKSAASVTFDNVGLYEGTECPSTAGLSTKPVALQAESYLNAFDHTPGNAGGEVRNDDVDIAVGPTNGFSVVNTEPGEWLEYEVDLPIDADYVLNIRYAAAGYTSSFAVLVDGQNTNGGVTLRTTGGMNNWQTHQATVGALKAGKHVLRLHLIDTKSGNLAIDAFTLKVTGTTSQSGSSSSGSVFPAGNTRDGAAFYAKQCAACHGDSGEGNDAIKAPKLVKCALCDNFQGLAAYVEQAMPPGNPGTCNGKCAADVSAFIIAEFNPSFDPASCNANNNTTASVSTFKRLSRLEYTNTIQDLLQLAQAPDFSDIPFEASEHNFNTVGEKQNISPNQLRGYLNVAAREAKALMSNGTRRGKVIACDINGTDCLSTFISKFGRLAYRRPLNHIEQTELVSLAESISPVKSEQFAGAIEAILISPDFLYRVELGGNWTPCGNEGQTCTFSGSKRVRYGANNQWAEATFSNGVACDNASFGDPIPGTAKSCYTSDINGPLTLTGYELLSRLSFALTGRAPNSALLDRADAGELETPTGVRNVIRDMLQSNHAKAHLSEFFTQWLALNLIEEPTDKPAHWYPKIVEDIKAETQDLLAEYAWTGKNFLEVLTANHSKITPELAKYYSQNVGNADGSIEFSDGDPRAHTGILTHAANMFAKGDGDLVAVRGNGLRRTFLCRDIVIPPSAVAAINGKFAGFTPLEIITARNTEPVCAGCHAKIDPIGITMVNYNGEGLFDYELNTKDFPVVAGFPDIGAHSDFTMQDLAFSLSKMPEVGHCIADRLFFYTRFKEPKDTDMCTIHNAATAFEDSGYDLPTLILALTEDESFRSRSAPAATK